MLTDVAAIDQVALALHFPATAAAVSCVPLWSPSLR